MLSRIFFLIIKYMFEYSDAQLDRLQKLISISRLAPYLERANNDRRRAIKLYERNSHLSEAIYGILQGLEIVLRNSFQQTLTTSLRTDQWYNNIEWRYPQNEQVKSAKEEMRRLNKAVESDRIVAQLSFGF